MCTIVYVECNTGMSENPEPSQVISEEYIEQLSNFIISINNLELLTTIGQGIYIYTNIIIWY